MFKTTTHNTKTVYDEAPSANYDELDEFSKEAYFEGLSDEFFGGIEMDEIIATLMEVYPEKFI